MLWLFGQIWLWLLAAFGLGVLLTWLVLGAVHRRQLAEAEAAALPPLEPEYPADTYEEAYPSESRDEPYLHTHPADAYETSQAEPYEDYPGELHPAEPYPPLPANDGYPRDEQGYPAEEYDERTPVGYDYPPEDPDEGYPRHTNGVRADEIDWPVEHAQPAWPTDEDWPPAEPRRRNW